MNNIVGLAFFALGIVLLIFGFSQTQPAGLPMVVGNPPAHDPLWLLLGGAVAVVGGLLLALSGVHRE